MKAWATWFPTWISTACGARSSKPAGIAAGLNTRSKAPSDDTKLSMSTLAKKSASWEKARPSGMSATCTWAASSRRAEESRVKFSAVRLGAKSMS